MALVNDTIYASLVSVALETTLIVALWAFKVSLFKIGIALFWISTERPVWAVADTFTFVIFLLLTTMET